VKRYLIILAVLGIALTANGQDSYVGPFIDSMWRDIIAEPNAHFQPAADSTTFFQVKQADGTVFLNGDSTNGRVGIGTDDPTFGGGITAVAMGINGKLLVIKEQDWMGIYVGESTSKFGSYCWRSSLERAEFATSTYNYPIHFEGSKIVFQSDSDNNVGLGEIDPETFVELTHATPYMTFHNDTHEDTDGGRESRIIFKGEQSGGEETTLARIEVSHDGAADDQKGKIGIYTNDGSDDDAPTLRMTIDSVGAIDVIGDFTAGTIQADDGVSGTLELDDGSTEKITLVFTGGILTSRTVAATTGSVLADWTD